MQDIMYRNDKVYAAFTTDTTGSGNVSAIRYLKINVSSNVAEINSTYGSDGYFSSIPRSTPDQDENIFLAFNRSRSTEYVGVCYAYRMSYDAAARPTELFKAGIAHTQGLTSVALSNGEIIQESVLIPKLATKCVQRRVPDYQTIKFGEPGLVLSSWALQLRFENRIGTSDAGGTLLLNGSQVVNSGKLVSMGPSIGKRSENPTRKIFQELR
jgi:hypothetical protein